MAELVSLEASAVGHAPAQLSLVEAATVPVGGLTASQALDQLDVQSGEAVLVVAAGGNVGSFAVQLAHARGATVIAQAGADDADRLKELGAAAVVDRHQDWVGQVREAADGGVDAMLDPLGADVLSAALPLVRSGGRVVTLAPREADPNDPSGVTITPLFVHPDGAGLSALAAAVDAGGLRTQLGQTFTIDEAAEAHRAYEQGASGKVVVTVS